MKRIVAVGASVVALAVWAGCSSDDDDGDSAASSTGTGAGGSSAGGQGAGGDPTPAESCVRPGDHGNSKGIGEYCTPGGGECEPFPEAALCLADVGQTQWFCAQIGCDVTTDCGEDAGCELNPGGSACIPCSCDDQTAQCQAGAGGSGSGGTGGTATGGMGGAGGAG